MKYKRTKRLVVIIFVAACVVAGWFTGRSLQLNVEAQDYDAALIDAFTLMLMIAVTYHVPKLIK